MIRITGIFLLLFFNTSSCEKAPKNATFEVTYHNFPQEAKLAFRHALKIWSDLIQTSVKIRIDVTFVSLNGAKGVTIPNGIIDFENAPKKGTWYPSSLADALANRDLQPGEIDIQIYLNKDVNWYFLVDGEPPKPKTDFVTVVLHEVAHGLGILSLAQVDGDLGSYSLKNEHQLKVLINFPFPELNGEPFIFDHFLIDVNGNSIVNTFENSSIELKKVYTGGEIYFSGPILKENLGDEAKINLYAPPVFKMGASISHLEESRYSFGEQNALMTPRIALSEAIHLPDEIVLLILQDLGWEIRY